jgi:hypothetical protein
VIDNMTGYDDYQKQVDSFKSLAPSGRATRYYVFILKDGRYVDIGSESSETQAYEMAVRDSGGRRFEIFPCNSVNISEVHRRFKKYLLDNSHDLERSTSLISRKQAEKKKEKEKPFGEGIF